MDRKYLYRIVGISLAGAAGWFGYQKYQQVQPLYALLQIRYAYESHDVVLFKKHVAIESVVNSSIDQVMAQTIPTASNPVAADGSQIASSILAFIKPRVVETIGEEVCEAVKTGQLNLEDSGDLAITSLKDASDPFINGLYKFDEIDGVEREGDEAVITLKFTSPPSGKSFLLKCKMKEADGSWQLVEILNTNELMKLHNEHN